LGFFHVIAAEVSRFTSEIQSKTRANIASGE
jgi:hypothetical protein